MRTKLLNLPRPKKRALSLFVDIFAIWGCLWLALYIRLAHETTMVFIVRDHWQTFLLVPACAIPFYVRMGLYRSVLRYMESHAVMVIVRASVYATGTWLLVDFVLGIDELVPRSVPVLYCLLLMMTLCGSRHMMRSWLLGRQVSEILPSFSAASHHIRSGLGIPVVIYGAGRVGTQLLNALDRGREYHPVAFIDDDISLQGQIVCGRRVYLSSSMDELIIDAKVEEILLALPALSQSERKAIVQGIEHYRLPIRTVPDMADIVSGRMKLQEIRDIDIGDVLGREQVKPDSLLMSQNITGQVVMVTGAGGSIGSELCRQIVSVQPSILVLFEHAEFNLYALNQELQSTIRHLNLSVKLVSVLGSVNDPKRLVSVMSTYGVNTIYHAAAYKHVPIVEHNLSQGLRNNVLGTIYTAQAAIVCGVDRFVLISTDKAVRPTNVMGASKRLAEMVLQALSREKRVSFYNAELFDLTGQLVLNNTCFTMVRFGNVLGSSGSVIPLFREQIHCGGPITVTHPDINRYFMTIPEASQLVIQAGAMGEGGDVFVLDMGKPIKVVDLARRMVQLSGLSVKEPGNPDGDIEIIFSGLRPGEKLYEELLIGDNVTVTPHQRIRRAKEEWLPWQDLMAIITEIQESLHGHRYCTTRELLLRYVNGFKPDPKVVDWLYKSPDKLVTADELA